MEEQTNTPSPAMQSPHREIIGIGELLKQSWELYLQRLWTLIPIGGLPVILFAIVGAIAAFLGKMFEGRSLHPAYSIALLIAGFVIFIGIIYLSVWSSVALLVYIRDAAENLSFEETYKRSRQYINSFFSTSILQGLATLGGFILLIVPGIIFALWFSQSQYVVITENLKNTAALKQSKRYVKGRMGDVFIRGLVMILIVMAISFALGLLLGTNGTKEQPNFAKSLASMLLNIFITPFPVIYSFLLFKSLKETYIPEQ